MSAPEHSQTEKGKNDARPVREVHSRLSTVINDRSLPKGKQTNARGMKSIVARQAEIFAGSRY